MGRHEAGRGSPPHPLVAAALARRPAGSGARHLRLEGGLGWPGTPSRGGSGLGWPGSAAAEADASALEEPAPARRVA
jgi:hypothetical protein